jgi:hypothetical protein
MTLTDEQVEKHFSRAINRLAKWRAHYAGWMWGTRPGCEAGDAGMEHRLPEAAKVDGGMAAMSLTTDGEVVEQHVLHVGTWSSKCGDCGRGCNPNEERHLKILGYLKNPGDGCGVRWTHITSDYYGTGIDDKMREMRPDLVLISRKLS